MSIAGNLKKYAIRKSRFQDIIFISGVLAFSAALILGFFPDANIEEGANREYFINLIMIIPILGAIYFLFISFSRKIYSRTSDFSSSIIFKMMFAFTSVAILPSLAIIIISNHIINITVSNLIADETIYSLKDSINLSRDYINKYNEDISGELSSVENSIRKGIVNIKSDSGRMLIVENCNHKGLMCNIYKVKEKSNEFNKIQIQTNGIKNKDYAAGITKFLQYSDLEILSKVSNISINNKSLLLGQIYFNGFIVSIIKEIPGILYSRINLYKDSLKKYENNEILKPYFQTNIGLLLLFIVILIVLISISVSYFLSRGITKPVLELAEAAGHVASGDFLISLRRDAPDELALLYRSFNKMVQQLDESKKAMYHAQKIEAWMEVARKLVHEIKNPLTPIRLAAERIQSRYREGHKDMTNIINTGTDTIIEEVKVLTKILDEFSGFARLPEMHGEYMALNPIIENSVNFFKGHEGITFHLTLDGTIPRLFIDKILIRQALTNILQNSIDELGKNGNITVKSEYTDRTHGLVRLSIKDDGPGIDEENLDKIFDPTFSTKDRGTGLGLAIVEKIILEHNARIFFYSKKGEGAEFVIEFPVLEEVPGGKNISS